MTITLGAFSPMLVLEVDTRSCDFAARLSDGETIESATVTTSTDGDDENAANLPSGAAVVDGSVVTQLLDGSAAGVAGLRYTLLFTALTSSGRLLYETGAMYFRPLG